MSSNALYRKQVCILEPKSLWKFSFGFHNAAGIEPQTISWLLNAIALLILKESAKSSDLLFERFKRVKLLYKKLAAPTENQFPLVADFLYLYILTNIMNAIGSSQRSHVKKEFKEKLREIFRSTVKISLKNKISFNSV